MKEVLVTCLPAGRNPRRCPATVNCLQFKTGARTIICSGLTAV
ncbi:MAG: hypothetical protein WCK61_05135 [Candidatus Omnitrophota bacterium]